MGRVPAGEQECGAGLCCPATSCPLLSQAACPTPPLSAHGAPWHIPGWSQPWDPDSWYCHLKPVCILVLAETRIKASCSVPQICAAKCPCSAVGWFVCSWTMACPVWSISLIYLEFRNRSTFNPGLVCVHRLLFGLPMASWYCTQQWDWAWDRPPHCYPMGPLNCSVFQPGGCRALFNSSQHLLALDGDVHHTQGSVRAVDLGKGPEGESWCCVRNEGI